MIAQVALVVAALLLTTTGLSGLATGRRPSALAAWFVPLPALLALDRAPALIVLPSIGLALFVGALWRNRDMLPLPTPAMLGTFAVSSLLSVLPFVAHQFLTPALPAVVAPLILPAALVVLEHAGARSNPFGTWGATAYTQRRNLPLLQSAAVTGLWGISFLVVWPATALASGLQRGLDRPDVLLALAVPVVVTAAVHALGAGRLARSRRPEAPRRSLAALSRPTELATADQLQQTLTADLDDPTVADEARATFATLHEHLLEMTAAAAREGAEFVVWPEADAPVFVGDATMLLDRIREVAELDEVHVQAGLVTIDPTGPRPFDNHLVLVDPAGEVRASYRKAKLVPGFEAMLSEPGRRPVPVTDTALGRIASAICFDLDFPDHLRPVSAQNADLLLASASDWPAIDRVHADMATFRAVENGVTLLRAARWGRSEVVDPYGRTLAAADHVHDSGRTLAATVPVVGVRTAHHRHHRVVPDTALAILLSALVASMISVVGS